VSKFPFVFHMTISLFFLSISACGIKAPPALPTQEFTLKIQDLRSEWRQGDLYMVGLVNGSEGSANNIDLIKGCRLYYANYSRNAQPCSGCPIDYHGFYEFGRDVISSKQFSAEVPKKLMGQISFFKVHLIGSNGAIGPSSNAVRVNAEEDR
jgi:hypothetical protein